MKVNVVVCVVAGVLALGLHAAVADEAEDVRNTLKAAQKELSDLTRGGWQSPEFAAARKVYDDLKNKEREKRTAAVQAKPDCAALTKKAAELRADEAAAKKQIEEAMKALDNDPDIQTLKKAHEDARKLEQAARKAVSDKIAEKMKADPAVEGAKLAADKASKEARDVEGKINSILIADNSRVAELQAKVKDLQAKYDEMRKKTAAKKPEKKAPRKEKK